jgi:hypothetical protein
MPRRRLFDPILAHLATVAAGLGATMARGGGTTTQQPGASNAPMPGSYFDVPGVPGGSTQWTEQDETSTSVSTTQSSSVQTQIQGIQQYRQTDVVRDWFAFFAFTSQAYTAGTGQTLTVSAYAPYNAIGQVKQVIQNQYASVDVENGIDLYIFNLIRPYRGFAKGAGDNVNNYANPAGDPVGGTATGYLTTALAQANQVNAAVWGTGSTSYNLLLRLPAAQWFDKYYDLAVTGEPLSAPHPALVSPQYMAGTTRVITPLMYLNPGFGAVTDSAPVSTTTLTPTSDSASTFSGTNTLRLRRRATYAGQAAIQPPVYAWQYRWKTQRFSAAGVSRLDMLVPLDTGQLLSIYVRMFDPAAASGVGAPININTVTRMNLQYGSGLFWFDAQTIGNTTAPTLVQALWLDQHGTMLPQGVLAFDLALDERQLMTNARALNTLTTAGILLHLEWSGTLSSSAYCVMGTESLVYVT